MARLKTGKGLFKYKPVFLYLGRKVIDKQVALQNLRDLVPLLNQAGIRFGPVFGTLLGMIRDNDFIDWDEDIDLYILKEDEELLRNAFWSLRDDGFDLVRFDKRGLYSVMRDNEYIDFYVLRSVSPELRHTGGADFIFEKYVRDTVIYDFHGIPLAIPRESEDYLEFTYGDWRTPVKVFDYKPSRLKLALKRLWWGIKSLIPMWLYPVLVRIHRRKDFKKFLVKCEKKGVSLQYPVQL